MEPVFEDRLPIAVKIKIILIKHSSIICSIKLWKQESDAVQHHLTCDDEMLYVARLTRRG